MYSENQIDELELASAHSIVKELCYPKTDSFAHLEKVTLLECLGIRCRHCPMFLSGTCISEPSVGDEKALLEVTYQARPTAVKFL